MNSTFIQFRAARVEGHQAGKGVQRAVGVLFSMCLALGAMGCQRCEEPIPASHTATVTVGEFNRVANTLRISPEEVSCEDLCTQLAPTATGDGFFEVEKCDFTEFDAEDLPVTAEDDDPFARPVGALSCSGLEHESCIVWGD
jgi:hypothetical protein